MPKVELTQVIAAPVERVFAAVSNLETYSDWNPTIRKAVKLGTEAIGDGAEFEFEIRGVGRTIQRLEQFVGNKRVRLVPQTGPMRGGHLFVLSAEGGGTRVAHQLEMIPKGLFKLFAPMMGRMGRKNLSDTAEALQRYLEG